jgi:hypothetical protein
MHVTSRLIVHPATLKLRPGMVSQLIEAVRAAVIAPEKVATGS